MLSLLRKASQLAVALATGGLRISAELKLKRADLRLGDLPFATSDDAVSREDILRIAAERAAKKYRAQFASITFVGDGIWDVRAARERAWRFIGIGAGEQARRLRQAGASIVIPDYRDSEVFMALLLNDNTPIS